MIRRRSLSAVTTTTTITKSSFRSSFLLLLLLLAPAPAIAQFKPWYNQYNFAYGAKARAMGNAFVAVADDLTAAFWNPAGLAGLREPEFYLAYKSTGQDHDYELQDRRLPGDTRLYNYNFDDRLNQIDFFAISVPFRAWRRPCTLAVGYYRYIPYGYKGTAKEVITSLVGLWPAKRTTTEFTGSEGFDVLAFSLGVKASGFLSLGVTLQQFFGTGSRNVHTQEPDEEYFSNVVENLRGRSFVIGALVTPAPWLRLGLAWRSALRNRLESTVSTWQEDGTGQKFAEASASCQARVTIPEQYAAGLLLRPLPWLDLSGEYSASEWQRGSIENYFDAPRLPFPQLADWASAQNQVCNLRFGAEARLALGQRTLRLRGGWSRERQLYRDGADAAVYLGSYSLGAGWEFSPWLLLEAAFQRQRADYTENGYFNLRVEVPTHFRANVVFLALTYRFGHIFRPNR